MMSSCELGAGSSASDAERHAALLHLSAGRTRRRDVIVASVRSRVRGSHGFQAGDDVRCGPSTNGTDDEVAKPTDGESATRTAAVFTA